MSTQPSNQSLFERAQRSIPGGVNSPVRAFRQVGGVPRFIDRAEGPYMIDVEGRRYIDYIGSWGPMIAGHAHPEVIEAVQRAATRSLSFGAPTADEIEIAELLRELMPSLEMLRLVSSGTEAAMSALRLARGFTGRDAIVKFEGCYHGHADSLLVKAGSGLLTFGNPSSAGVPADVAAHTLVLEFNNIAQLEDLFAARGDQIACVLVEPIAGNMNFVRGDAAWHQRLRELCTRHGTLLVWDEVMTGFRVALGGAQQVYGIRPDLVVLGKVIGGGMPMAAFGGRADVMAKLSPLGGVYQAGTLSGNPVAVAAGMAQLRIVRQPGFYDKLAAATRGLMQGLEQAAARHGVALRTDCEGGMFGVYFAKDLPRSYADVARADLEGFKKFFHAMLERGVYLAPSMFEAGFVSSTHDAGVIAATLQAADAAFAELAAG
ncbi:MAG: glutamate-1-semialdehyde 2,1-aminomutase [Betaproteobacteria bacterium]|nr:glutamate-1-semialdehyde 2,1-aminomutase [Betaproteobacteria bacterium]